MFALTYFRLCDIYLRQCSACSLKCEMKLKICLAEEIPSPLQALHLLAFLTDVIRLMRHAQQLQFVLP